MNKKGDEMMCLREWGEMYPRNRVKDAKEMCKDRYVLICVSFSVLNAARPDKGGMERRVSKEWTR